MYLTFIFLSLKPFEFARYNYLYCFGETEANFSFSTMRSSWLQNVCPTHCRPVSSPWGRGLPHGHSWRPSHIYHPYKTVPFTLFPSLMNSRYGTASLRRVEVSKKPTPELKAVTKSFARRCLTFWAWWNSFTKKKFPEIILHLATSEPFSPGGSICDFSSQFNVTSMTTSQPIKSCHMLWFVSGCPPKPYAVMGAGF